MKEPAVQAKTPEAVLQKPSAAPSPVRSTRSTGHPIHQLQRAIGNQAVLALLGSGKTQAKLEVGGSDDPAERAADRAAERVMSDASFSPCLCGDCPRCRADAHSAHRKPVGLGTGHRRSGLEGIGLRASAGQLLDPATRSFFEPRFGQDFGEVRIHDDRTADRQTQMLGARAFAVGDDIAFRRGEYNPATEAGRRLIAHELAHVVQTTSEATIRRQPSLGAGAGSAPGVKRDPAIPEPPPIPQGRVVKVIDGIQMVDDELFMYYQLRQLILRKGREAPREFYHRAMSELGHEPQEDPVGLSRVLRYLEGIVLELDREWSDPTELLDVEPCRMSVGRMTNAQLLGWFVQVRDWLRLHSRSADKYNDFGNLMRRMLTEREHRTNRGDSWLGEEITAIPERLYELQSDPQALLRVRIVPIANTAVSGAHADRTAAPVMSRLQVMRMLELNRLPVVDPERHYRDQGPGSAVPLTADLPPPKRPRFNPFDPFGMSLLAPQARLPILFGGVPRQQLWQDQYGLPTAGGIAGMSPYWFSPTPTAGQSLDAFSAQVYAARAQIQSPGEIYDFYSQRTVPLPAPTPEPYRSEMLSLSTSGLTPKIQARGGILPYSPGDMIRPNEAFYHYSPQTSEIRYRIYVNAAPEHAVSLMRVVVREFVEGGGVPASKVAAQRLIGTRRDNLLVTASDLPTLERILLRLRTLRTENPTWFVPEPVPMTDPILPGVGLGVEPPSHDSFGTVRSQQIFEALQAAPAGEDLAAFQARVRRTLLAAGVDPAAPHAARDLRTLAPERRLWLQAGGSAMGGYHMGGLRSPAAVGTAAGAGLGGIMTTVEVLRHPEQHPHPYRDIAIGTGTSAVGAYASGAIEFSMASRFAPIQQTQYNASFGVGMRGTVLPRMGGGAVAGAVVAPLTTWAQMGINQFADDADYTRIDYLALGARSGVSGTLAGAGGAGAAALTGFIAGSEVPVLGNIVGAGVGLLIYWGADALFGDDVESSVRLALGEGGCKDVTVPD